MRVLHVSPSLALRQGGVSSSVRELCRGLASLGTDVEAWTTTRGYDPAIDGAADESLRAAGVKLRYFPIHPLRLLGERYAYSPTLKEALLKGVSDFDLVHIHAVWLYTTRIAARACRKKKIPYILSPCGALDHYGFQDHGILKRIYGILVERRTVEGAALIDFTSSLEQEGSWTFGVKRPSVVIPCSIPESNAEVHAGAFRKKYPEIGDQRMLLFLGRLHPKKRLDLIARAFIPIARQHSYVHLVVAGPDQGAAVQARGILEQALLLDRVTFTGFITGSDKQALLHDSTLFLLPSEDENFGVAALEAMAAGLPILLSPGVGLASFVEKAGAGMVMNLDVEKWVKGIGRILNEPGTASAMGNAGRKLASEEFSIGRVALATRDAYSSILQRGPL